MSTLEIRSSGNTCRRCGIAYNGIKGYFQACYAGLYKGVGYLPYCKKCVDEMYMKYLSVCDDPTMAIRQTCRKLDLYWHPRIYESVLKKNASRSLISSYIANLNIPTFAGKTYDDTLIEEGTLWSASDKSTKYPAFKAGVEPPSDEVIDFWGPGYTPEMYAELEQRLNYYRSQMGSDNRNMNTDALLRQIAMLEIDINKARADGKAVDKMVATLNTLLGSLVKPTKKDDMSSGQNTPFGVWIKRWEDERPLPEVDDSMKDVDGIIKYVLTWVYGHIAHMLKIKNAYSKLYEDEIARLRVERPEYDDEDDEAMIADIFGSYGGGEDEAK